MVKGLKDLQSPVYTDTIQRCHHKKNTVKEKIINSGVPPVETAYLWMWTHDLATSSVKYTACRTVHGALPANSGYSPYAVSMLGQHRRQWANIEKALSVYTLFAALAVLRRLQQLSLFWCNMCVKNRTSGIFVLLCWHCNVYVMWTLSPQSIHFILVLFILYWTNYNFVESISLQTTKRTIACL